MIHAVDDGMRVNGGVSGDTLMGRVQGDGGPGNLRLGTPRDRVKFQGRGSRSN